MPQPPLPPPPPALFAPVTRAVNAGISGERAFTTVEYVQRFFRLPGNQGFDLAIDSVAGLLRAAGYVREDSAPPAARFVYRIESRPMRDPAWTPIDARITLAGRAQPLQTFATNLNMIAINSGATPTSGVTARVIDVGGGSDSLLAATDLRGHIVFTTGNARQLFPRAMQRGAIGVLATQTLPAYNRQAEHPRAIQFGGITRDTVHRGWLLFLSAQSADSVRTALAGASLEVHVAVQTRFEQRPERTLIAEIRGTRRPEERFIYSAHVQEPGANDNASGVGALAEMARVAADLVRRRVTTPQRTLTFLWGDEIRSTARFLSEDTVRRTGVKWGMSLDMVGENTARTGGTFLIEKMPDPSAVWVRGEDRHTEWGGRVLAEKDIRPHWFNDFVRQRCLERGRTHQWVVQANPYEGGSDHTPFLTAGIPAVLLWHFTDRFYHTDLDRIEMVSAATLANVGACALTTGLLLVDGSAAVARAALTELVQVAERALTTQARLARDTLAKGSTRDAEQHVLDVWRDYYLAAIDRVAEIAVGPVALPLADAKARVRRAMPLL
jgi:aminopeptidase YwaD